MHCGSFDAVPEATAAAVACEPVFADREGLEEDVEDENGAYGDVFGAVGDVDEVVGGYGVHFLWFFWGRWDGNWVFI